MRTLPLALLLLAGSTSASERYVGGGALIDASAPLLFLGAGGPKVSVTQLLYTRNELQIPTGGRIIDIAWRKADLLALPTSGCDVELWMKNVMLGSTIASGSTQTFGDATNQATRVFSGTQIGLPSTMGFVTLAQAIDAISFDYTGNDLEVTVVANCTGVSGDVAASPLTFRYDTQADRARYFVGDAAPTAATVLAATPPIDARRPHTRFRFLNPVKTFVLRVGDFVLNPGATYGTAAKHLAMGKVAPFRFTALNDSTTALTAASVLLNNNLNGIPMQTSTALGSFLPGEEKALTVELTPTAAALTRFTMTVTTDAVASPLAVTFQGTATATPEAQPNLAELKADKTSTNLPATGGRIQLGNVAAGSVQDVNLLASNFGAADGVPVSISVTQQPTGGTTQVPASPAPLDTQVDRVLATRVTAPTTPGMFTTVVHVTIGASTWDVTIEGTVQGPEIDVDGPSGPLTTPAVVQLGAVAVGDVVTRVFTIKNTGQATLHVARERFSLITDATALTGISVGGALPPAGTQQLTVGFTATSTHPEIVLEILSDDSDEPVFRIRLTTVSGSAPRLAVLDMDQTDASKYIVRDGQSERELNTKSQPIRLGLLNLGDSDLTVTGISLTGIRNSDPTTSASFPITVPPSGTVEVQVLPQPTTLTAIGDFYELGVSIASDDPAGPFAFRLNGLAKVYQKVCSLAPVGPLGLVPWVLVLGALGLRRRRDR